MDHELGLQKSDDSPGATEHGPWLKLRGLPVGHFLATHHPRINVNRKNDKDMELMRTSKRRLGGVSWSDKCRELHEAAAFQLSL
jgi:hypothetical protein